MPKLEKVIETALYSDNLKLSIAFYKELFELEPMVQDERLCAFNVNGQSVFLLFAREECHKSLNTEGGMIPGHIGKGSLHVAFAIEAKDLLKWEERLVGYGVPIVSRVQWPLGGTSIYFHDPDGHLIELATPGLWKIY